MKKTTTQKIAANSMLAAMCAVLGFVSIDMGNLKLTLESVPILIGALLFGPADGALIGFVGTFVYQLLRYGISATTFLWILPYVLCGLVVGLYSKRREFALTLRQTIFIVLAAELMITLLNTGVMYIDSKIYGYYSFVYIFGTFFLRLAICIGKAVAEGSLLPSLLTLLKKAIMPEQPTGE